MENRLTKKSNILKVLNRETPQRIVYAPNYWQWFAHQVNHCLIPDEIKHCKTQLDVIRHLDLDVLSRNIYSPQDECLFGGMSNERIEDAEVNITESMLGKDKIIKKRYITKHGELNETLRYNFKGSTLIQEKFLLDDYENQLEAFEDIVNSRKWTFNKEKYLAYQESLGEDGIVMMGEVYSPLKLLHRSAGPVNTTYMLVDYPDEIKSIMDQHETNQLNLIKEMVDCDVPVIMAMDNLDTMFHPPQYVEQYSASFYEKASALCHEKNSNFFIHACGQQKDNLKLISSLGVDGLEGFAYPPLGDMELDEAMKVSGDRFIITGGISAFETKELITRKQVFEYVKDLFNKMKPYANRFVFSASCNTEINAKWETLKYFRDAWQEYGSL